MKLTRWGRLWVSHLVLVTWLVLPSGHGLAQVGGATASQAGEPLGPWATAAFVWVILVLVLAFVVAMGWLSRSRRY